MCCHGSPSRLAYFPIPLRIQNPRSFPAKPWLQVSGPLTAPQRRCCPPIPRQQPTCPHTAFKNNATSQPQHLLAISFVLVPPLPCIATLFDCSAPASIKFPYLWKLSHQTICSLGSGLGLTSDGALLRGSRYHQEPSDKCVCVR